MKLVNLLTHYVAPRYSNNQHARILHSEFLILIAIMLIGLQALIGAGSSPSVGVLGYAANIPVDQIVSLTNQKRSEIGVGSLTYSDTLSEAARQKGEDMLRQGYWAHVAPDGTEPWDFFANVGYAYRYAGENLARDFSNPTSAVEAWMASTSHRENLLSDRYKEIGVAVVEGDLNGVDTTIIVQLFGTKSESLAQIPNVAAAEADGQENNIVPVANAQEAPEQVQPSPKPSPAVEVEEPVTNAIKPVTSPFIATKAISMFVIGLLAVVLVIDIIVIERKSVSRVSGRKTAHLAYLITLIVIILISKAGQIL